MSGAPSETAPRDDGDAHSSAASSGAASSGEVQSSHGTETRGSSSMNSGQSSKHAENNAEEDISARLVGSESRQVFWSRITFLIVLLFATAGSAVGVYMISRDDEKSSFEVRFKDFANQIVEVSQINANDIFGVFERMSLHMTVYAEARGQEWPFVVVPSIEAQGQQAIEATGAITVAVTIIVTDDNKEEFENFTVQTQDWIQKELDFVNSTAEVSIIPKIWYPGNNGTIVFPENQGIYIPSVYMSPIETLHTVVNYDAYILPYFNSVFQEVNRTHEPALSEVRNYGREIKSELDWPRSFMAVPIFDTARKENRKLVGQLTAQMPWHNYFLNLVPEDIDGIYMVVRNTCDQAFTYLIDGPRVEYLGVGELHETDYNYLEVSTGFTAFRGTKDCTFSFHLYPSTEFRDTYRDSEAIVNTVVVVLIFVLTAMFFIFYDQVVEKRQNKVLTTATKSHAIVSSLFPENVRDRLLDNEGPDTSKPNQGKRLDVFRIGNGHRHPDDHVTQLANGGNSHSSPIADFFESATVLFADIVGFTAWSSTREPVEVFTLLESIYNAFDKIAVRMGVFKVETIGDCYVAACGLPEPRNDHAIVMFRFCRHCLAKMNDIVHHLAGSLGPDTAELSMRFGMHSGSVTAGVLRGQKSRFQLFGDTVNTAARVESSGAPNRIHMSQDTADEIVKHGKSVWVRPREDMVTAKGKGQMKTYWGVLKGEPSSASSPNDRFSDANSEDSPNESAIHPALENRKNMGGLELEHHVEWNAKVLEQLLKRLVASRDGRIGRAAVIKNLDIDHPFGTTTIDEVRNFLPFRDGADNSTHHQDPETIDLSHDVLLQLSDFVRTVAGLYRQNDFHSFAHASHVVQGLRILFSRISSGDLEEPNLPVIEGLSSDPLVQFAAVFSALVHDVDHLGVPNSTLTEHQHTIAKLYNNKSIAEQHSVDLAWNLLMEPQFTKLRACIYTDQAELDRFRELVVQAVMATDIMDKELNGARRQRWEAAFANDVNPSSTTIGSGGPPAAAAVAEGKPAAMPITSRSSTSSPKHAPASHLDDQANLQATVVYEHLLQGADVAHTMQHWHTYIKWNERLFQEMYKAFRDGHIAHDPSKDWYEGEMKFFDFYVIPLAKRLKACNVLGVTSNEYLNHAEANRIEWEQRGEDIVKDYWGKYVAVASLEAAAADETEDVLASWNDADPLKSTEILHNMPASWQQMTTSTHGDRVASRNTTANQAA